MKVPAWFLKIQLLVMAQILKYQKISFCFPICHCLSILSLNQQEKCGLFLDRKVKIKRVENVNFDQALDKTAR